jgi:hypothetical protein
LPSEKPTIEQAREAAEHLHLHVARDDGWLVAIDTATKDGAMVQHATVRVEYGL